MRQMKNRLKEVENSHDIKMPEVEVRADDEEFTEGQCHIARIYFFLSTVTNIFISFVADMCCKVCYGAKIKVLNLPCGHLCCCRGCAVVTSTKCPLCKQTVQAFAGIYFS